MSIPTIPAYPLPTLRELSANKVDWQPDPARSVLLVHDMQQYFTRFYGADNPVLTQVMDNIAAIIDWARKQHIPLVYTAQPADQPAAHRALLTDMWGPGLTGENPSLQQIEPTLALAPTDTLLVKWRYSAFQRSHLQDLLQDWQRDQLIIVGIYAHIGCLTTALDAFMRDIQAFMVADAVADFSLADHQMALNYVAGRCGAVTDTQALLQTATQQFTREELQQQLLTLIDENPQDFDPDENLVDYGLDSIQVMNLISDWQKRGLDFRFEELARQPTLNGWWQLIQDKTAA